MYKQVLGNSPGAWSTLLVLRWEPIATGQGAAAGDRAKSALVYGSATGPKPRDVMRHGRGTWRRWWQFFRCL